ncbi:MAG: DUF58 domain-containing protein [Motilibacteraceae bacterium]
MTVQGTRGTRASGRGRALVEALRGSTTRGRCFLVAGAVAVVVAILLGQRDLLRIGVLVLALPVLSAWVVSRTRYRLALTRTIDPVRVGAGSQARVVLRLDNVSRLPTGLLLVEDRVPYALGSRPRFVLDRVEPRGQRAVAYTVRSDVRGRYDLGPLTLRLADPFGLCELTRGFTATDTLIVTPAVEPLPSVHLGGEWSGSGESRSRSLAAAGEDDVTTREYRYGDPLHRVHWRATARAGQLMVRREEQPWQSRATLLLDTRGDAHLGEGPGSSFEWAVAAAASLGVHLVRGGYAVRLVTDTGASVASAAHDEDGVGGDFEGTLLDALAVVAPSRGHGLAGVAPALRRGGEGLLVAVLGALDLDEASLLTRVHHKPGTAVALLLDTSTWSLDRRGASDVHRDHEAAAALLLGAGWRVLRVSAGDSLAALWGGAVVPHQPAAATTARAGAS